MRRHMIFDGAGKSVENTCGRVISRLRQGYRVHICIVLASYDCMANIAERFARTGRDAPAVSDDIPRPQATDVYVRRQSELADEVVLYINENLDANWAATVRNGEGVERHSLWFINTWHCQSQHRLDG